MHDPGVLITGKDSAGRCRQTGNTLIAILVFLFVLLSLFACSNESPSAESRSEPQGNKGLGVGTIVAVGDSLTAGYDVDETRHIRPCWKNGSTWMVFLSRSSMRVSVVKPAAGPCLVSNG